MEDRDEPRTVRAKVTRHVLTLDEALQSTMPALLALLDVLPEDSPFLSLIRPSAASTSTRSSACCCAKVRCSRCCWSLRTCTGSIPRPRPSWTAVERPTARLLLLINYRPEYQHGWGGKTYYLQLRLDPLPPVSAEEFLQALLGDDLSLVLKQLLIARTQSNLLSGGERAHPGGDRRAGRGAWRLSPGATGREPADPATVQAILAARMIGCRRRTTRTWRRLPVIGTEVPWPLLQAIADAPEEDLHRGLGQLQAAEFLYETSLFPEHAYTFKHALTHEVAYNSLLQERRRALHTRIVEAIEGLSADRLTEQVERLAHHALRGEGWDKALAYCRQASAKAATRSAYREAVAYFEQALTALQHLPSIARRSSKPSISGSIYAMRSSPLEN